MAEEKKKEKDSMGSRIAWMLMFFVLAFAGLIARLAYLQLLDPQGYGKMAKEQHMQTTVLYARRGSIYDRNGIVLAQTAPVWRVIVDPTMIEASKRNELAAELASILDMDVMEVSENLFAEKTRYRVIKKQIESGQVDKIREYAQKNKIGGISFEADFKRYYPYGHFASTVLGFTGDEHQGLVGLEYEYDEELSGMNGRILKMMNAKKEDMPFGEEVFPAQNGHSLVLTIDETVQHIVEKRLEEAVEKNGVANQGVVIVINVKTGEIVAMATKPDFDPNDPFTIADTLKAAEIEKLSGEEKKTALLEARYAQWKNKAVSDTYEPGSVFKVITSAMGLDSGNFTLDSMSYCNVSVQVADQEIKCWSKVPHGQQNYTEALMHSCNPSFVSYALKMGATEFFRYFKAFGFTEKSGIDLPSEQIGRYYTGDQMGPVELATASFGQTFTVTPIQMITAIASTVNGGYLVVPHTVKSILDENGNVVQNFDPIMRRQVISEEVSAEVAYMMGEVVSGAGGSGKNAYVAGFRVGGKTGTTEKTEKRDADGQIRFTISSFVGIAPSDDPEYAILVLLDEPNDPNAYASTLAAPVVGQMFSEILFPLGVEPRYTLEEQTKLLTSVPNLVGKGKDEAAAELARLGFNSHIEGEGTIAKQTPKPGQMLPKGGQVVLYTEAKADEEKLGLVPNVEGRSPAQAKKLMEEAGLNPIFKGGAVTEKDAKASYQSEVAGDKIPIGSIVTVEFLVYDEVE